MTDRPTNQPTDKAGCRIACTRLKIFRKIGRFSEEDFFFYGFACQIRQNILCSIGMNKFFLLKYMKYHYMMYLHTFLLCLRIKKIKNNLRDIEPQNGKKFKRIQAELKKGCLL